MLHPDRRHVFVVLSDRVLHVVRDRKGARLLDQARASTDSPTSLLEIALLQFQYAGQATLVMGMPWARVDLISLPAGTGRNLDTNALVTHALSGNSPPTADVSTINRRARAFRLKRHLLISSLREDDLESIVDLLSRHHIVAGSIQPLWTWLTLSSVTGFRADAAWLVLLEPGFVTIAHQTRGEPDFLRSIRTPDHTADAGWLSEQLNRQVAATGLVAGSTELISLAGPAPELAHPWTSSIFGRVFSL